MVIPKHHVVYYAWSEHDMTWNTPLLVNLVKKRPQRHLLIRILLSAMAAAYVNENFVLWIRAYHI